MENAATGLPVLAMPSTTRGVQFGSMPMTTTAATLAFAPVPIIVRKCSSRSSPNCSRPYACGSASVPGISVADRLGGGVGDVVDGQDDHVVADADAAVGAAVAGQATLVCHLALLRLWVCT